MLSNAHTRAVEKYQKSKKGKIALIKGHKNNIIKLEKEIAEMERLESE